MANSFQSEKMFDRFKSLLGRKYSPLNRIDISKDRLLSNYRRLVSAKTGLSIAPVLKSNAYGHGIVEVASVLDVLNPPFFCVDSIYEAYQLLNAGIKTKILIMGYVDAKNLSGKRLPFSYAVSDADSALNIFKEQPKAGFHIFVDTGMHREGIPLSSFSEELQKIASSGLNIEGIMSHCASADEPHNTLTVKQLESFSEALEIARQLNIEPKWKHIFASSGIINIDKYSNFYCGNLARSGLAVYGIGNVDLKPVLTMKSTLVAVKEVSTGDGIGYGFSFVAQKKMKVGVVAAGYHDGVDRRLSSVGKMQVLGVNCPILGIVSMNQTVIDISDVIEAKKGDEVVVFSDDSNSLESVERAAQICKTIPYDLLVGLDSSTRRNII